MNSVQNAVWDTSKVTIPSILGTYNFFTGQNTGKRAVRLTGAVSYKIFSTGSAQTWGKYAKTANFFKSFPATQKIIKVARSNKAAAYALAEQYWAKSGAGYSGDQTGAPFPASWNIDFSLTTTNDVCNKVATTKGAIGFGGVSLCRSYKAIEALLQNKAGVYQNGNRWDEYSAIPRSLPDPTASWSSVSLLYNTGPQAPPIASFSYALVRLTKNGANNAAAAKAIIKTLHNSAFAKTLTANFQTPIPQNLAKKWAPSVEKIAA